MRQVLGNATVELAAAEFAALRDRHAGLLLDLGAGDGKHALAVARARPDVLVVALDASPDGLRRAAARGAAKPARGGVPNAVFVWAAVEQLPPELAGVDEVHCLMPWGSLLRALAGPDPAVLRSLASACAPGAGLLITLNLHAWRPPVPEVGDAPEPTPETALATLGPAYAQAGWALTGADRPGAAELAALGTSWTKRLGSSRAELAVLALRGRLA
ncbi:class I SAM-dependent methyltransferase [uncultured Jatrophihabitans sp.]|uniref:class I SAM-dependent methyltransferase n=1 Tax=uncultured Jatrophihabitans sp. TaxID=1610747 RepID=UPI0035C9CDC8